MSQEKVSRLLDRQFARFLALRSGLGGAERERFQDLVCRLSMGLGAGDSCLLVTDSERSLVHDSSLVGDGQKGQVYPLILEGQRLYLQKFFSYEEKLAEKISELRLASVPLKEDPGLLTRLFPPQGGQEVDWQREAAVRALRQNFLIISGGPGTGKTSTVVKLLALLQGAVGGGLRIALAAPTGKAAMRLQESIVSSRESLALDQALVEGIPDRASTLHRLLGVRHHSPFFGHHRDNPLPYDVVVVDEASMVDLALMTKLACALRPGSRLILLGDRHQLASVESGTVLADLGHALPECCVELKRSYRFDAGIKGFAEAIKAGDAHRAWHQLEGSEPGNVGLLSGEIAGHAGLFYARYMEAVMHARTRQDYKGLFGLLHSFKILCAVRKGPLGVSGVNAGVEAYLSAHGHDCQAGPYYLGRPLMMTKNDYGLDLYNGDMGICLPDLHDPEVMKIWFERSAGQIMGVLPRRISDCETVYAMTIHKSQGTEIDEVLVVLPRKESELVTRELLYTAVTRARERVWVKGSHQVFERAVCGRIERASGLVEKIVGRGGP